MEQSCHFKAYVEPTQEEDKLWIVWVHTYYLKGRKPWEVLAKQAFWIVKKMIGTGKWLEERNLHTNEIMEAEEFSIQVMYKELRGEYKVPWRRLTCNNQGDLHGPLHYTWLYNIDSILKIGWVNGGLLET